MSGPGVHVALLRGINVGGRNQLPMAELVAMFEAAGCSDVRTYIQSGNVIYRAKPSVAEAVPAAIQQLVHNQFGYRVPVVTRTAGELRTAVEDNPYARLDLDPKTLHVSFLADMPSADRVAELDLNRSPPDEMVARGREIYLHLPNGVARSKFTNAYFDSALQTVSTLRNWRTTLKLLAMVGAAG